jgi:predicted MFS family arabinose efflux permease
MIRYKSSKSSRLQFEPEYPAIQYIRGQKLSAFSLVFSLLLRMISTLSSTCAFVGIAQYPVSTRHSSTIKSYSLRAVSVAKPRSHHVSMTEKRQFRNPASVTFSSNNDDDIASLPFTSEENKVIVDSLISSTNADFANEPPSTSSLWLIQLVLPLWLVYISNQWSRSSLYYLVDFSTDATANQAMNVDIGFSQTQYGVLASIVFTTLFAIGSIGAGVAADRINRKTLTILSAITWSVATFGTAYASSYSEVVICRIIMGLACAFTTPTAYTLIANRVPSDRRGLATSLYGTGVALGSAFSSLSLVLDQIMGWRQTLVNVALFGLVATTATFVVVSDDPIEMREAQMATKKNEDMTKDDTDSTIMTMVMDVVATERVRWILLASFLRFCAGLCIGVWSASFFKLSFQAPTDQANYAIAQALISAIGASFSGILGGYAADKISSMKPTTTAEATSLFFNTNDPTGNSLWIPVIGSILACPAWYFAISSATSLSNNDESQFTLAMTWVCLFLLTCFNGRHSAGSCA